MQVRAQVQRADKKYSGRHDDVAAAARGRRRVDRGLQGARVRRAAVSDGVLDKDTSRG